jgi:hypothetical protein
VKMKDSTRQLILLAPILSTKVGAAYAQAQGMLGDTAAPPVYEEAQ